MIIAFSPLRSDKTLALARQGDALSVNGEIFDFSELPEGACLPQTAVACNWLASDVTRKNGQLCLTLILPHGPDASEAVRFPEHIYVVADGSISLPCTSSV